MRAGVRQLVGAAAFAIAGIFYVLGLSGQVAPWLLAAVVSLFFLTLGFGMALRDRRR